ncbi:MAG: hypothetical protein AAB217_06465, partial [Chloroflexota bacterium]
MTRQKGSSIVRVIKIKFQALILEVLALATVTQGGVEVQLVPNPDQAGYSPNQMVQVKFKPARMPCGADQRLRMVGLDLQSTIPFLAPALPLTHDRGTPGTDNSYTNAPREHANNTHSRIDMNVFTTNDYRSNGSTSGQVIMSEEHRDLVLDDAEGGTARGDVCDDTNVCTDDSITPTNECIYTYNSNSCDDNSACTTNDHCSNGSCSGTTIDCNDSNECTDDSCNPSSGCVHANNSNSCDDG